MNEIGLFFNFEGQSIQLPINPEKLEVTYSGNNKTVEIIQLGEVNILKKKNLATIKFNSWFPYESWFPYVKTKGQFKSCDFYDSFFRKLQDEAKPARFIVTGYNFNTLVSVEDYQCYHQGGDYEDLYYSLSLKEYVEYSVQTLGTTLSNAGMTNDNRTENWDLPVIGSMDNENWELPVIGSMDKPIIKPEKITIGCSVILNGDLYDVFNGVDKLSTKSNLKCKVLYIKNDAPCQYHLCDDNGKWLGWAKKSDVQIA